MRFDDQRTRQKRNRLSNLQYLRNGGFGRLWYARNRFAAADYRSDCVIRGIALAIAVPLSDCIGQWMASTSAFSRQQSHCVFSDDIITNMCRCRYIDRNIVRRDTHFAVRGTWSTRVGL